MQRVFDLLDRQPESWPRWERGQRFEESLRKVPTEDRHLFLFEPYDPLPRHGTAIAACRFVTGAIWIDRFDKIEADPQLPCCPHCLEVDLQYGLLTT